MRIHTLSVIGSMVILVHATLCAIQRAPRPRRRRVSRPPRRPLIRAHAARHRAAADREWLKAWQEEFTYPPIEVSERTEANAPIPPARAAPREPGGAVGPSPGPTVLHGAMAPPC